MITIPATVLVNSFPSRWDVILFLGCPVSPQLLKQRLRLYTCWSRVCT